jgi:hypothetical protein
VDDFKASYRASRQVERRAGGLSTWWVLPISVLLFGELILHATVHERGIDDDGEEGYLGASGSERRLRIVKRFLGHFRLVLE